MARDAPARRRQARHDALRERPLDRAGHARRGAIIARRLLWEAGVGPFARERICALVRHHMAPYHLIDSEHAVRRTLRSRSRRRAAVSTC